MTGSRPDLYERARELDDNEPDDVCPGCGMDLTNRPLGSDHMTTEQWEEHVYRYMKADNEMQAHRAQTAFIGNSRPEHRCVWTNDMIVARAFRRRYIRQYEQGGA